MLCRSRIGKPSRHPGPAGVSVAMETDSLLQYYSSGRSLETSSLLCCSESNWPQDNSKAAEMEVTVL